MSHAAAGRGFGGSVIRGMSGRPTYKAEVRAMEGALTVEAGRESNRK